MKKRLRGTIALLIAFCVAFTGLPFLAGNLEANALAKKKKLPKKITLQVAVSGQTQAVLKWNKIKSPSKGYAVFRNGEAVKHFNTKKIAFTDSNLKAGTTYTYQIKTYTKKKVRMWFNKKTEKWQKKKPAKKYRGKSRKETVYTYKKKSNAVTVHTAAAPAPANPTDTGDSGSNGGSNGNTDPAQTTYTITWKNWNGAVLKTTSVKKGETPVYSGTNPSKAATNDFVYSFKGWTPTIVAANGNATYTAEFTAIPKYTITWKNWDGTILDEFSVREGTKPVFTKATPSRPADSENVYTFSGWTPSVVAATSNKTYTATYTAEPKVPDKNYYTATWKNWNGETLATSTVEEGKTPTYSGNTPSKPTTSTATYTFNGWSPTPGPINANTTYTAQFKETKRTYTITWVVNGSSTTTTVNAGDMPVYNGTPTKPAANGYKYTFAGWSPTVVAATQNATYTAQFNQEKNDVSPLGYTYKVHLLTEPYGNAGTEQMLIPVYIETNNNNGMDYPQGYTYDIKNANGNKLDFSTLYDYNTDGDKSRHIDFKISSIPTGTVFLFYTSYTGKATIEIYEYDNNMKRTLVTSKQITIKNYDEEEQKWVQSVINKATDSSMTNSEKMFAICRYISEDLDFKYTKVDKNNPNNGYLKILADEGKPYWIAKRANSYISPTFLEEFGKTLGYPLHNCYYDYEEGSAEWKHFHYYVYSEADDLYFEACPATSTGYTDVSAIEQINLSTYQFWGE